MNIKKYAKDQEENAIWTAFVHAKRAHSDKAIAKIQENNIEDQINRLKPESRRNIKKSLDAYHKEGRFTHVEMEIDENDRCRVTMHPSPYPVKTIGAVILAILVIVAASFVYVNYLQDHPMEELTLESDSVSIYAGEEYEIVANILPDNTSDKSLKWTCNNHDVLIESNNGGATIIVGPTVKTGTTITVTATSEKYNIKDTISFEVINDITIDFDSQITNVAAGDTFSVGIISNVSHLEGTPRWSTDKTWVKLKQEGSNVSVSVDLNAQKGSVFTISAELSGLKHSQKFTVTDGLTIRLSTSSNNVEAGESFTVTATVTPASPAGSSLLWTVDYGGITYKTFGNTLSGVVSENADHNVKVTITAQYPGYSAKGTVTLYTSNHDRVPVNISSVTDLKNIQNDSRKYYVLQSNIDMSGTSWTPFDFSGTLNGNGYIISGLNVLLDKNDSSGIYYAGLFRINTGMITDLTLADATIIVAPDNKGSATTINCGALVAENKGTISNCTVSLPKIISHSTNIKTSWLSTHDSIPTAGTGKPKAGDWYDYASLKFTGTWCTEWACDKKMIVNTGGIAGINNTNATISGSTVLSASIDAQVVNFHYSNRPNDSNARTYVGGIVGQNYGSISDCISSGTLFGGLDLHDSGEGTKDGMGYDSAKYIPKGKGYIGGIAGFSPNDVDGSSSCQLSIIKEAYAPRYEFLVGSHYNNDVRGFDTSIIWKSGEIVGGSS